MRIMRRAAEPGSDFILLALPVEALGVVGYCAWVAASRPAHVLGVVATLLMALNVWFLVAVALAVLRLRTAGRRAVSDQPQQGQRLEAVLARIAPRAELGEVRLVARPSGIVPIVLRRIRGSTALLFDPDVVAARDEEELVGTLSLLVAGRRRQRVDLIVALMLLWVAVVFVVPTVLTSVLTGDQLVGLAFGAAVAGAAGWATITVLYPRIFSPQRLGAVDAEAVRIAGGREPVIHAMEQSSRRDIAMRQGRILDGPLLWPARAFFAATARRAEPVFRQRMERLRGTS